MKKKWGALFCLGLAVLFTSCAARRPIEKQQPGNNETYSVNYLFEHEGTKVYRFYDRGNYVYFTSPSSVVTSISRDSTAHQVMTLINP